MFTYWAADVQESATLRDIVLPYLEMSNRGRGGAFAWFHAGLKNMWKSSIRHISRLGFHG